MRLNIFLGVSLLVSSTPLVAGPVSLSESMVPNIEKIVVVEFENTDYKQAILQPTFAKLAKRGASLSNFYGVTHPSQPNYLALIGGETFGVKNDNNVTIDEPHLGDLIESAGKSWKVYAGGFPGNCFLGSKFGAYARKHVPFLSFRNLQEDSNRCANIVNGSEFVKDLAQDSLPSFSLFIPDLSNDGHDTGVAFADNWLDKVFLPSIDAKLPPHTLIIFTFDESTTKGKNHIYTSFVGDMINPGSVFTKKIDHYGLLHTIEAALQLGSLGKNDQLSPTITDIWK